MCVYKPSTNNKTNRHRRLRTGSSQSVPWTSVSVSDLCILYVVYRRLEACVVYPLGDRTRFVRPGFDALKQGTQLQVAQPVRSRAVCTIKLCMQVKKNLYKWWKSMIEVAVPALHLKSYCAMLYTGHKLTGAKGWNSWLGNNSRHYKPLPMQLLGAVIAGLRRTAIFVLFIHISILLEMNVKRHHDFCVVYHSYHSLPQHISDMIFKVSLIDD